MKVKDFMQKVNYGSMGIPVYLKRGISGEARKVEGAEFEDCRCLAEKDRTLMSISIEKDRITVYYK